MVEALIPKEKISTHNTLSKIEEILKPILSPRQPMGAVEESLSSLSSEDQLFALHWIQVMSVSNIELTYTLAVNLGKARTSLSLKSVRVWLHESLALYDREGLYPAMQALNNIEGFKENHARLAYTSKLVDVKPKLDIFIRGLSGRSLALKPGDEIYTDTEHLYLPKSISKYREKHKNKSLYKAMACFLWAQTWYGTFKREAHTSLSTQARLDSYSNSALAKRYFLTLENIRLLANIERDLPGLFREMSALSPLLMPKEKVWKVISKKLGKKNSTVEDTFEALDVLLRLSIVLPETDYKGSLNLAEVELKIADRKTDTFNKISELLNRNIIDENQLEQAVEAFNASQGAEQGSADPRDNSGQADKPSDAAKDGSSQLSELLKALLQDVESVEGGLFGDIPSIEEQASGKDDRGQSGLKPVLGKQIELDEWDYLRQSYREHWCRVNIKNVDEIHNNFKQQTERKYPFLMTQIRKVFEAMRDQPRYANRQTDGEDIDLDAVVNMYTARLAGEELSERMYIRRQRQERSVSVCLLVDMSGSTKGWINLAMRESLILFSEALNTLGDQYAIIGFSGLTRQRCEIYTVKEFSEEHSIITSNRISNIQAKDYTRMGFAVRYATQRLLKSEAKHRILLLLSDGKPDDYDGYQGEYGIQDTRKAILEAQGKAINPFSITIDKQAQIYLPRLFGPGQYMILDDVSTLPLKLSEVYRKLSA